MKRLFAAFFILLTVSSQANAQISPSPVPSVQPQVVYQAPEIGLLPDSPLYKIRLALDRISLILSPNPYTKARKYVALADRELTTAVKVLEKGNGPLALHTAFRGENYMTLFVNTLKVVADSTDSLDLNITKLAHDAYPYHLQVIQSMIDKSSGDIQQELQKILEFSQRNENELNILEAEYSLQ